MSPKNILTGPVPLLLHPCWTYMARGGVHIPRAIYANFQRENGQRVLRGSATEALMRIANALAVAQYQPGTTA